MANNSQPSYAGIEGGGPKFVCAVGTRPDHVQAEARFQTTSPEETLTQVVDFFKQQEVNFGGVCYVDLFANDLEGVKSKMPFSCLVVFIIQGLPLINFGERQ